MKMQYLAVIFIIIVLPISMVLTVYTQNHVKTIRLQTSYDTKLTNSTYDALKAYQLNTINSDQSDLRNSKIRDIEASINTFFNALGSNFNMPGYNQEALKGYVPALVYTMYDGYYIYSPYTNKLTSEETNSDAYKNGTATFKNNETIHGLKPYIYYSCRYRNGNVDVVINYSLDNYISVKGKIGNDSINESGYIYKPSNISDSSPSGPISTATIRYRDALIESEVLYENVVEFERNATTNRYQIKYGTNPFGEVVPNQKSYKYIKINGLKYYHDDVEDKWFNVVNGEVSELVSESYNDVPNNYAAKRHYRESKEFTTRITSLLSGLNASHAVDENGNRILNSDGNQKFASRRIFDDAIAFEESNSNFNQHRLEVIRYTIEKNLSIAIANFNSYTNSGNYFLMPELEETDWDKILNNTSIISFLQGLSIGTKVYNGYSVVTNTKTSDTVNLESIYLITNNDTFHSPIASEITGAGMATIQTGRLSVDFERKSILDINGLLSYYYPRKEKGSYTSIVNQQNVNSLDNTDLYRYIQSRGGNLAQKYFTALGRERFSMYKNENDVDLIKQKYKSIR